MKLFIPEAVFSYLTGVLIKKLPLSVLCVRAPAGCGMQRHEIMRFLPRLAIFLLMACVGLMPAYANDALYVPGEVLVKAKGEIPSPVIDSLAKVVKPLSLGVGLEKIKLKSGITVEQALAVLAQEPAVEYVQPNYIKHWQKMPNDLKFGKQWGLRNTAQSVPLSSGGYTSGFKDADIDADGAWNLSTGDASVIVAVIDSGVDYTHPDLAPNIWHNPNEIAGNNIDDDGNGYKDDVIGWDFANGDNDPVDLSGHGTHVAGIIAAKGNDASTVAGVGWKTSIMALQVVDVNGVTTSAGIAEAIRYAVDNGAKVINASYGETVNDLLEYDAINYANTNGVLVVAAACNKSSDNDVTPCYPSSYDLPNIIAVAASDLFDNRAGFSNYGATTVDLAAPGVSIVSTYPTFGSVWSQDFSTSSSGWTHGGTPDTWAVSSGTLQDSPSGNYIASADNWVRSPVMDLTDHNACRITTSFDSVYLQNNIDKLLVEASTDASTWTTVGEVAVTTIGSSTYKADITAFDGSNTFYFRYRLQANTDATVNDGVFISNAAIECYGTHDQNSYAYLDGTSVAAPFVAGTAALLEAYDSSLTMTQVRDRILNGVDQNPNLASFFVSGGRLNTARALNPAYTDPASGGGGGAVTSGLVIFLLGFLARMRSKISKVRRLVAQTASLFVVAFTLLHVTGANADDAPTGYRQLILAGSEASSEFGYSTVAGDFNGDGLSDVAVGISSYGISGGNALGRVEVYYGRGAGLLSTPDWSVDGADTDAYFGGAMTAGDVDGDGVDDLLIGAPGRYDYPNAGKVYIYLGASVTGLPLSPTAATADVILTTGQADDNFGMSIAVLGDVNGNTYPDVMVGAYEYDLIPANVADNDGAVFIYYGDGTTNILDTASPTVLGGPHVGAQFGRSVALAGYINDTPQDFLDGTAWPDIIIGADYYTNGESGEGGAFVYYGTGTGTGFNASYDWSIESDLADPWGTSCVCLGASVASAGDVNGDGYDDVIVGAWSYYDSVNSIYTLGEALLFHGSATGLSGTGSAPTVAVPSDANWQITGANSYEAFGTSIASVGDLNSDGNSDVIVGIEGYCDPGNFCGSYNGDGKAVIYYGSDTLPEGLSTTADWSSVYSADRIGSHYGAWVKPAGDVDDDGKPDFMVSAYHYSVTSPPTSQEGAVFVYLSGPALAVDANPTSGLSTDETGGTDTFSLKLTRQPTANVTVAIDSSNTNEGTVSPDSVTFTPGDWDVAQIVTVTGVNDDIADGLVPYGITLGVSSTDLFFDGNNPADVTATNADDDTAGVVIDTGDGVVTENGTTDTFTIVLTSQPTANVTIGLSSNNPSLGTVSPSSLTFKSSDWNAPQTVTVTGTGTDPNPAGATYTIVTAADTTTTDINYINLDPVDVTVTSRYSTVTIAAVSGSNPAEPGTVGYFRVTRDANTSKDLVVNYSVTGGTATSGVDFTALSGSVTIYANYASADVPITPINDLIIEGNETVVLSLVKGSTYDLDPDVNNRTATVTIVDDDADAVASFTSNQTVAEGSTVTVYVTLNKSAITYPVTIPYTVTGTATNPADHDAASGTIKISSGTTGSVVFHTYTDNISEGNETVIFTMGTPTNATIGTKSTQTVTITDGSSGGGSGGGGGGALGLGFLLVPFLRASRRRRNPG
jgi:subtilisin family serine protease